MRLKIGALANPPREELLLLLGERLSGVGRRHPLRRIGRQNAPHQLALPGIACHEHMPRSRGVIEAQISLPCGRIGTVALKAVLRKDRPNVAIVLQLIGSMRIRRSEGRHPSNAPGH